MVVLARGKEALDKLQSQYPQQVRVVAGDMANFSLAQTAVDVTIKEFGQMDGLIINHAVLPPVTSVGDCDVELWKHNFDVNFFSAVAFVSVDATSSMNFHCSLLLSQAKAALPTLRKSHGRIILTSTGAAVSAYTGLGAYGSSKAALNHLAKTLNAEEPNVITIAFRPGAVDTEMQRDMRENHASGMDEKDSAKFFALHKEGKLLRPEQPGHVMAKLVLEGSEDLSGEFLRYENAPFRRNLC